MRVEILTIFPRYFDSPLAESLLGKAIAAGVVEVTVTDLRDFAVDKHRKVDDEPFGGGPGMVMTAPVAAAAVESRRAETAAWSVLLTPDGVRLDQRGLERLAARGRILLFCGRYEGLDERARQIGLFDQEISLGDFVLPGGESAALALIEGLSRLVPGVVGKAESVERESSWPTASIIRTTPGPASFGGFRRPKSSFRATTPGSSAGAALGPWIARASAARTCSSSVHRNPTRTGTSARYHLPSTASHPARKARQLRATADLSYTARSPSLPVGARSAGIAAGGASASRRTR